MDMKNIEVHSNLFCICLFITRTSGKVFITLAGVQCQWPQRRKPISIKYIDTNPYNPHEGKVTCLQGRMTDGRKTKTVKCASSGDWSHTPTFCSGNICSKFNM